MTPRSDEQPLPQKKLRIVYQPQYAPYAVYRVEERYFVDNQGTEYWISVKAFATQTEAERFCEASSRVKVVKVYE